jgi:hypothetical protein
MTTKGEPTEAPLVEIPDDYPLFEEDVTFEEFLTRDDEEAFREFCDSLDTETRRDSDAEDGENDGSDKKRIFSSLDSSSLSVTPSCSSSESVQTFPCPRPSSHVSKTEPNTYQRSQHVSKPLKSSRRMVSANDIRAQYSHIFARAYNHGDRDGLMNLLNTYCTDDVICVYKYVGKECPYGPMYTELVGKNVIIEYWELCFVAVPDMIFNLHETKIRVLPNNCCVVISKFTSTGTKAMALTNEQNNSTVYSENSKISASDAEYRLKAKRDKPQNIQVMKTLEQTVSLNIIGTVTYFVNGENKVNKIEYIHCVRS